MSPLRDLLPPVVRKWVYTIIGSAFAVEGVLDSFESGLLTEKQAGIGLGIAGVLGFSLARSNTPA